MAEIRPFGALRFTEQAGELGGLACPPYDIISEEERERYRAGNACNIIRLELPREGENPYEVAGETLRGWLQRGMLACDQQPGLYIYEEEFLVPGSVERKKLRGFLCRVRLEEWEKGVVLPHEETLSKAKADRFELMKATGCNFSAIYSLYFDRERAVLPRLEALSAGAPDVEFASRDGIVHRVWKAADSPEVRAACAAFADKPLYIADGHHRYETAVNYRNLLREQGVITDAEHPANFVMMMLVNMEHPGLVVFPTHRIVRGLEHFDAEQLIKECGRYFDVRGIAVDEAEAALAACAEQGKKALVFCHRAGAELCELRDGAVMDQLLPGTSAAYRALDVNILHSLILERLLGIDKENMANQKNLVYTRDPGEAVEAVRSGAANCAFLINPTRIDEIADVAAAGEKMPQKSTYFYPKIITGHIMNRMLEV